MEGCYLLACNILAHLKVCSYLHPSQFSGGRVSDVEVPRREQLVTEVDGIVLSNFNVTLVVCLPHSMTD